MKLIRLVFCVLGLAAALGKSAAQLPDGLYAKFTTTKGVITAKLYYDQTPRTVAHFVALAEGTQPFIDFSAVTVTNRHFYDGLLFHRVIKGFVIQTGSPNGIGTDGPGYTIANEIKPALKHSKAGILGAARTSQQDTYGAQFYFTLTNTPALDGQYTVWGETVDGLDVVLAIGDVATDTNDKPTTPVVLQKVEILRIGAAAMAFDPAKVTPALPLARNKEVSIVATPSTLNFTWQTNANAAYRILYNPGLTNWPGFGGDTGLFQDNKISGTSLFLGSPEYFFRLFEVQF